MSGKRPNWDKIEAEYLRGGVTLQELADKHGVSERTVERHASEGNWAERRREVADKVAEELPGQVAEILKKEASDYIAASLGAVESALALAFAKMTSPGLEFKSLGEATTAIAKLAKTQAELAKMADSGEGDGGIDAALDALDEDFGWEDLPPEEALRRYREETKRPPAA